MKIVIGTPIRDVKGYSIGAWLKSIAALEWTEPIPVVLVDNTDDTLQADFKTFVDTKIAEANLDTKLITSLAVSNVYGSEVSYRLVKSWELLRQTLIAMGADVWFSLECDVIAPPDTLKVLSPYLTDFDIVCSTYPDRDNPLQNVGGIGCSLYKIDILNNIKFYDNQIDDGYGKCDPLITNCYYGGESWFVTRALRMGYKQVDFTNLIALQHLAE